jgi:hypothetical protein
MQYRLLGGSGFKIPVLSLGTGTFGGGNEFFKAWGASDVAEATKLVDICLDAGLNKSAPSFGVRLVGADLPAKFDADSLCQQRVACKANWSPTLARRLLMIMCSASLTLSMGSLGKRARRCRRLL